MGNKEAEGWAEKPSQTYPEEKKKKKLMVVSVSPKL